MSVYEINGTSLQSVYGVSGELLSSAYDIDGEAVFPDGPIVNAFTVMTFNVQQFSGVNSDQTLLSNIYSAYEPDIIGIQELSYNGRVPSAGQSFLSPYQYYSIGSQYNKTGFFSTIQITDSTFYYYDGESGLSQPYGYQKCYFEYNDKTICWVNAHLRTSSQETKKVAEAAEIFNAVQNETHFIITGDFNTVCKSVNDTEYTTIMKQFIDAGYHSANCSNQHGFINTWTDSSTGNGTWYPTDHIITSSNIQIISVVADQRKIAVASQTGQVIDHLPFIAELVVN